MSQVLKIRSIIFVITFFLCQTSGAMTKEEQTQIIKEDQSAWAKATMVNERYAQPPEKWQRVDDPDMKVSLYFPCAATKKVDEAVTYTCAVEQHAYTVQLSRGDFGVPAANQARMAGQVYQIRKRFKDAYGDPVTTIPTTRLFYAGALGREEKTISPKVEVVMRTLFLPTLSITMSVAAKSGELPDDVKVFFNSLQIIK
ncbi:MAG TPA: hypothetical protein VIF60_09745 [Burkholderiaceae bacterium]